MARGHHALAYCFKGLTYAPTGGIVAAPTTSLPEEIGGVRNWDYRYCWLRDATFTLVALSQGGYHDEAKSWREWLLRAIAGTPAQMQIIYGVRGERRINEFEIPWLKGYENSRPVRIGNAASTQFQLDVYGEIVGAIYEAIRAGMKISERRLAVANCAPEFLGNEMDGAGRRDLGSARPATSFHPFQSHGLVRVRARRAHGRGIWLKRRWTSRTLETMPGSDSPRSLRARLQREEKSVHAILRFGRNGRECSARAAHRIPPVRTTNASATPLRRSSATLLEDGFILRYRPQEENVDGLPGRDGAFLPCSFWYASCLHWIGEKEKAREWFERLLALRNDLGLLAEEYDPRGKTPVRKFSAGILASRDHYYRLPFERKGIAHT